MNLSIPEFIETIVSEISEDKSTVSIWLVGSRANGYESESSDWDILYFSTEEPTSKKKRHELVDTIHVGPLNTGRVYGSEIEFPFDNWEWKELNSDNASYVGRKFINYPNGIMDVSDPVYETRKCNASCMWRKKLAHNKSFHPIRHRCAVSFG